MNSRSTDVTNEMTDASTTVEAKNNDNDDKAMELEVIPDTLGSPGRRCVAIRVKGTTKHATGRVALHVIRSQMLNMGAVIPVFSNLSKLTEDQALIDSWNLITEKGILVERDVGCWIPHTQYWPRKGQSGRKVGYHCSTELFSSPSKTESSVPTVNEEGWPMTSQISHLCHLTMCCNPTHIVVEPQWKNLKRNYCGGSNSVGSKFKCDCGMIPSCIARYRTSSKVQHLVVWSYDSKAVGEKVRKSIGNFGVLVKLSDKHAIQKADEKSKNELKRRHSTQQHKKQHEVKQARLAAKKQKTTSQ